MSASRPIEERFWDKVSVGPGCWDWIAAVDRRGYGLLRARHPRRLVRAHRVSWELHYGAIPSGVEVCHSCDRPRCVRPGHLFLGTHRDNLRDAWDKGRLLLPWTYRRMHEGLTPEESEDVR